jgi:hypothetical protein
MMQLQPAHRNQQHTATVLLALTLLLVVQTQATPTLDKGSLATLLTAAAGQDFAHLGGKNQLDSKIESFCINRLKAQIDTSFVSALD